MQLLVEPEEPGESLPTAGEIYISVFGIQNIPRLFSRSNAYMGQSLEINVLKVYGSVRRGRYGFQQQFPTPCINEVIKLLSWLYSCPRKQENLDHP